MEILIGLVTIVGGVVIVVGFLALVWWLLKLPAGEEDEEVEELEELLGLVAGNWDRIHHPR